MKAFLSRKLGSYQTTGQFVLIDQDKLIFSCKTLEPQYNDNEENNSCIYAGDYIVEKHISPKYGECLKITDVFGRTDILIHWGNYRSNTLGCVLVGAEFADINKDGYKDITNSKKTFEKLMSLVDDKFDLFIR